jgi:hypothetical protein
VDYRNSTASGKAEARLLIAAHKPRGQQHFKVVARPAWGIFSLKSGAVIRKKW